MQVYIKNGKNNDNNLKYAGDLETFTVFICNNKFPNKRRDSYLNPDDIPSEFRQKYMKKISVCFRNEDIIINDGFYHACHENTPKNGVLTAIEDFLKETELDLTFKAVNAFHGLGILYPKDPKIDEIISEILSKNDIPGTLEKHYLKEILGLISYFHEEIRKYRKFESIKKTYFKRPDLLEKYEFDKEGLLFLNNIKNGILEYKNIKK